VCCLKRAYLALFLLAACVVACATGLAGCVSQAQNLNNATLGVNFYNYSQVHYWKDNVTMNASNVTSTWNMTVYVRNDTLNGTPVRYMQILTQGNGMYITYDVWSDPKTMAVTRMHAKGYTGDYFQDKDTSVLQINTLPDVGLSYYFVPFWPIRNMTAKTPDGNIIPITVYSASDNKGLTVSYWMCPYVPVPMKAEVADPNLRITETLVEYG